MTMFDPLTELALDWAIRCFGRDHVYDQGTRTLRIAEEAVELIQAADIPKEKALQLVEMVYARPKGHVTQEIGGVLMTTTVLCAAHGVDPKFMFLNELRRVLAKDTAHFAKRNQEKIDLGMKA